MVGWQRTFWAVWFANFVAAAGMQSFLPFFPTHVESLGVTDRGDIELWSGLIFGAAPFSAAFLTPIWGALGDRFGRRLMVLRALLGLSLFVGLMGFATRPEHLFLLRLGQGIFSGFMAPSITLVSFAAPPGKQGRITGSLQVSVALGAMAGPLIGASFGAQVGLAPLFRYVSAAAFVGALAIWFFAREPDAEQRTTSGELGVRGVLLGTVRDLRDVMANRAVRGAVILLFALQFAFGSTKPLLELFVRDVVGPEGPEPVKLTGWLVTSMALASTVSLRKWGSWGDEHGYRRALWSCAAISAVAMGLHVLVPGIESVTLAVALLVGLQLQLGVGMAGASPSSYGLAGEEVSADRRGGAFGVLFGARTLAMATSAWVGGYLARFLGVDGLFGLGALVILATLAVLVRRQGPRAGQGVEGVEEADPAPDRDADPLAGREAGAKTA